MATMAIGQSSGVADQQDTTTIPQEEGILQPRENKLQYVELLKPTTLNATTQNQKYTVPPIEMKKISYLHGKPYLKWTEEEVSRMNVIEKLQHAVVGKFSYGWPDMDQLRTIIPEEGNKQQSQHAKGNLIAKLGV